MAEHGQNLPRASVDGRFFRRGAQKLCLKGVAYGPFMPNAQGEPFASPDQTGRDFAQIRDLGANLLRIYHVPPRWFLDLAAKHDLLLLIDMPWNKHLCFLDSVKQRNAAHQAVLPRRLRLRAAPRRLRLQRRQRNPARHRPLERREGRGRFHR